jgi:hypothetical protein
MHGALVTLGTGRASRGVGRGEEWQTSNDFPLTGRHIAKMLDAGFTESMA